MSASAPVPVTFESMWAEFCSKVKPYSALQKKHILRECITALQGVLNQMPAPRREGLDEGQILAGVPGSGKRLLPDVEALIYDRMHATGSDKSLFLRFDGRSSGLISVAAFKTAIASIGLVLTDEEVAALAHKFPGPEEGSMNWNDLWKYLQAAADQPRSSSASAFSPAHLNRQPASGKGFAALMQALPESLDRRMARGLKVMREWMYHKSLNFHSTFLLLQNNQTRLVAVSDLLPHLPKMGFPVGVCSDAELNDVAAKFSIKTPGSFTYTEFLYFVTGHDPNAPATANQAGAGGKDGSLAALNVPPQPLDSPDLMNALVKINNLNLRKFFKELDADSTGVITTAQLCKGLCEQGNLHVAQTRDPIFIKYIESFCKRKPGHFGYSEFLKFINTRVLNGSGSLNGLPNLVNASAAVKFAEDATPSQMLETLVKTMRNTNLSIQSIFETFDSDSDRALDEAEFYQAVCALGFVLTNAQSHDFFNALDTDNSGAVNIEEFSQLVVNPNKSLKLHVKVRHAPGGASSVHMGSFAPDEVESRPQTSRAHSTASSASRQNFNLAASQAPPNDSDVKARPAIRFVTAADNVDLAFPEEELIRLAAPGSPKSTTPRSASAFSPGGRKQTNVNSGAGGASSIDFVNDHGHIVHRPVGGASNKNSDAQLLHFDPLHPVAAVRPRSSSGRPAQISLVDEPEPLPGDKPWKPRPIHSPSKVSFDQTDSDPLHTGRRILASPGGNSSFTMNFDDDVPGRSLTPVAPVFRSHDQINIDLSFDETGGDYVASPRRARGAGLTPNQSSIQITHASSRDDADLEGDSHMSAHKQKKKFSGAGAATLTLDSSGNKDLLDSYRAEPVEVDPAVLKALSTAVYAHSQRIRHTFQEWGRNSQSAVLTKENFAAGARNLNIQLTDAQVDALFERFDTDGKGGLSYSEFVRCLST